jgi:hypothetical protein
MALRTPVSYAVTTLKARPEILDVAQIYWFASRIQSATIEAAASWDEPCLNSPDELVKRHGMSCCPDQNPSILTKGLFAFDFIDPLPYETDVCLLAGSDSPYPMRLSLRL